jgi:nicotinic acid mononucleotide adenylyltransferase
MAKKSFKSKAINAIISAIVNALYVWAREWGNNAYFYILIGDDKCQDVAWHNSNAIETIATIPVANDPKAAALFESMTVPYHIFLEDNRKNEKFEKAFQEPLLALENWYSEEF